jgi:hypothetical protein
VKSAGRCDLGKHTPSATPNMRSLDRCVSAALAVLKVSIRLHCGDKFQSGSSRLSSTVSDL